MSVTGYTRGNSDAGHGQVITEVLRHVRGRDRERARRLVQQGGRRLQIRATRAERAEFRPIRCEGGAAHGLAALRADLIKWMFIFWAGTTMTVLGTTLALLKF